MRRLIGVGFIVALSACAGAPPYPAIAPDFVLTDLSGKTVRLSDFRGHPVLVDFWATWCVPCRESIPVYKKLFEERRAGGFVVAGIDEDDAATDVAAFSSKNAISYPLLRDPGRRAFNAFRVGGLPTAFLIDAEGRIRGRWDTFDSGTAYEVEHAVDVLQPKK